MGTENFNYIQPSVAHGENVALQHAVTGAPVSNVMRVDAAQGNTGANVAPAGLFSTAPYVPPGTKQVDGVRLASIEAVDDDEEIPPDPRYGKCIGKDDTCNAWATKKWAPYCNAHGRSEAGLSSWAPAGGDG